MVTVDRLRGGRILRSAPWPSLLASLAAALLLLCIAAIGHGTGLTAPTTLLGLAACGAAAAHGLDEAATSVADASPTSRRRRLGWRMLLVILPMTVAIFGLLTLNYLDPETQWLRLFPLAAGTVAIGTAVAAVMRRHGSAAPGDLAGAITLVGVILVVAIDPLRRWVQLLPFGDTEQAGRSSALWFAVVGGCIVVTLACTRDPGRPGTRILLTGNGNHSSSSPRQDS
jgi:hypothetical protein